MTTQVSLISSGHTGSRAIVLRITASPKGSTHQHQNKENIVFVLKSPSKRSRPINVQALEYEAAVYRYVNRLVEAKVCPFFLRLYGPENIQPYPRNLVVTESFHPSCIMPLRKLLRNENISSKRDALNLLIPLVYTIEVMYRTGLRHNDLHTENIMILRLTKPVDYTFHYRDRQGIWSKCQLQKVRYMPLIYDMDRATKTPPQDGVKFHPAVDFAPPATVVTKRFPWHDTTIRSEKMELHKLFEEIYHGTAPSQTYLYHLMQTMCFKTNRENGERCLHFKPETQRRVSPLMNEWFFKKFYITANKKTKREVEPDWVGNAEDYYFQLVQKYNAMTRLRTHSVRTSASAAGGRPSALSVKRVLLREVERVSMKPLY